MYITLVIIILLILTGLIQRASAKKYMKTMSKLNRLILFYKCKGDYSELFIICSIPVYGLFKIHEVFFDTPEFYDAELTRLAINCVKKKRFDLEIKNITDVDEFGYEILLNSKQSVQKFKVRFDDRNYERVKTYIAKISKEYYELLNIELQKQISNRRAKIIEVSNPNKCELKTW